MGNNQTGLKREIGILGVVTNVLSISIGSGIFLLPALVFVILGNGSILAYIFCGLIFLALGLCFAEVSSRISDTGGMYVYIERAFGPLAGFLANITYLFGVAVLACAALLNAMADIASTSFPLLQESWARILFFVLILGIISLLSVRGIKDSMVFVKLLTFTKVLAILALVIFGFSAINIENIMWTGFPEFSKIGEASLLLIFAFLGGELALSIGGEMKNPKRTAPLGFVIGIFGVVLIFCLIHLAVQGVLGQTLIDNQDAPLAELAKNLAGNIGFILILIVSFIAVWSTFSSIFLLKNRILYAGAVDGLLPKIFAKLHPKYGTPAIAILFLAILELVIASTGTFRYLLILVTANSILIYFGAILAFFKFRLIDKKTGPEVFKVKGGYFIGVFALIALAWVFSRLPWVEIQGVFISLVTLILIYFTLNYLKIKREKEIT
ncbi:APC family permease [Algoriphagus halophilus]|uniref:Amino acid/polyamine/organocation transporter, APC superfamily n=1 Tax=Algoriphagus halophilus TaxID=226505 RepID=A0A1N6G0S0_9BACT|nr:APC family permease [Algoriphagus halophilus]SIO01118.1 amino acid/polyamine/organocation transporter, APC superfamily [Algoriphagus halophilus]